MKKIILSMILVATLFGKENIKIFTPSSHTTPDLSVSEQKYRKRLNDLMQLKKRTKVQEKEFHVLLGKYGESSVWEIGEYGCSWYCGGGNYDIKASSSLNSQAKNSYAAKSANDLSYKTAWVEGKKDAGVGEYLEYSFRNKSPRITTIIISNGYMKTEKAWQNNNRVKALKFYVNSKFFGILKLTDTRSDQHFKIGTFGHRKDGKDLIFRFEIFEVYKGKKYNDTAITEIYFDGIDVH